jgi:hypothetical protein
LNWPCCSQTRRQTEVLGELLNEYVGGMTDVIFAHDGTVAEGGRRRHPGAVQCARRSADYATRAVACAHDLDSWAEEISRTLEGSATVRARAELSGQASGRSDLAWPQRAAACL